MIVSVPVGAQLDRKVILLPMAAIHQGASPNDLIVYELLDDVVRARKVSLGGVYNNEVEVVPAGSEVKAGSKIVVSTAERLTDGIRVRAMQDSIDSAAALAEAK
jgi:hypothetical protein